MTARYAAHGTGHGEHGQAERQRHTRKSDPELGIGSSEHGTAASAEDQPERAEKFGHKALLHAQSLHLNQKVQDESAAIRFRSSWGAPSPQASRKDRTVAHVGPSA
ncbi:hypothetical protein GGQ65_001489 [Rhizobium fabae]|uniref:Uncharacterized protein n=1 Tax=Rhizobium fabae TaxID=573179 RepID=A0A7W6B7V2_9HYPH|nr:hypothetical protein [Rhizobium fabae]